MINKVILVGNVGADPEVRTLDNGIKMARIRLATTERVYIKEKNETKESTEWHNVTLWRGLADVVDKYVRKGMQLYIEGKLRTREFDKNGVKCYATDITADELKLLGKRDGTALSSTPQVTRQVATSVADYPTPPMPNVPFDEMPF
jgi:single-strand DNA-binding protein